MRVAYLVGRLDRALRRRLGQITASYGLTLPEYTALAVLNARGKLSNAELARRAFVTPQAMNELVQGMQRRRLVSRSPDPLHGRLVQIQVTSAGRALLRKCDAAVRRLEETMLERLSAEERVRLQEALRSCIHALDAPIP
mgnify:CR=1 FL=1